MNILITGGTGFVGQAIIEGLDTANHTQVWVLTRNPANPFFGNHRTNIHAITNLEQIDEATNIDVVINLAGQPIADNRWSKKQKKIILDSRVGTTKRLLCWLESKAIKPKLLISASAIGFYGVQTSVEICNESKDLEIDETGKPDSSFSSELCQRWESEALAAAKLGIRTCIIRIGIVLGKNGGALNKMLLPFKLGLGGRIGSGKQWMPWIHLYDLRDLIFFCIDNPHIEGILNATAPNVVTNKQFSTCLASALSRPAILPMPAFVIKLLMGQMGEELLLSGKKVVPKNLLSLGYSFSFPHLNQALANILENN